MSSRFANLQKTFRRLPWNQRPQPLPGLRKRTLQKLIASFLLLTMTSMVTLSAQAAAQQALQKPVSVAPGIKTANLSDALKDLHESLHKTQRNASTQDKAQAGASGILTSLKNLVSGTGPSAVRHQGAQDLLTREATISKLEADTLNTFAATEAHLKAAHLPATILQRHYAAVQQFQQRSQVLHSKFASLRAADNKGDSTTVQTTLGDIDSTLSQWEPKARQVDPNHLPWGSPSNKVRAPYKDKNDYLQHLSLFGIKPIQVAYNGNGRPVPPGTIWPTLPQMKDTVEPGDTQPTEDVQITQPILDLAAQLNYSPVKIFQWVHDNIRYIPTYGSIQGSDYTLQLLAGNDADTASLLIALLRASNIPARYVYGTINVPVTQVENWVGGVNNADAALNLLGQGGVPSLGLATAGQTTQIQMEHVWVEAFVSYVPSRGWVNNGKGDTWVPLDASFKQYDFAAPTTNIKQAVAFDAAGMIAAAEVGATIDSQNNAVQNLSQPVVQSAITNYQQQIQAYLTQHNTTLNSALVTQSINPYKASVLSPVLPYPLVTVGGDFDSLPSQQRHGFHYQVYLSQDARDTGSPAIDYQISLPSLQGHLLALSFRPASDGDAAVISSYMPSQHADGTAIQVSELPRNLPGYLISVVPELTLDGQVVATSTSQVAMGTDLVSATNLSGSAEDSAVVDAHINAGEYRAIGVDSGGISGDQMNVLQSYGLFVQQQIQAHQPDGLTKHDYMGTILQSGVLYYFALNDMEDQLTANIAHIVVNRLPSFGTLSSTLAVRSSYGIPQSVGEGGVTMDITYLHQQVVDVDNDAQKAKVFNMACGLRLSDNEHIVPEKLFSTQTQSIHGISAVKALQVAANQGQKIFSIDQSNISTVYPQLTLPTEVLTDINNAVQAGKSVTVSQSSILNAGWSGAGYLIIDPETGSGAYRISGGVNGGNADSGTGFPFIDAMLAPAVAEADGGLGESLSVSDDGLADAITLMSSGVELVDDEIQCHKDQIKSIVIEIAVVVVAVTVIALATRGPGGIAAGAFAVAAFALIFSTEANAATEEDVDCVCENQNNLDRKNCRKYAAPRWGVDGLAICYASASTRYGECLSGGGPQYIRTPLHGVTTPL